MKSSILIDKTARGQAKPPCIASPKVRTAGLLCLKIEWANSIPVQDWGYMWRRHLVGNDKTPLQNHENILKILGKNLNFAVKKDVWCSIIDIIIFNIKNWLVIAKYQVEECKSLIKAQ